MKADRFTTKFTTRETTLEGHPPACPKLDCKTHPRKIHPCSANAPVASPATPSAFPARHEALSRGGSSFSPAFSLIELLVVIAIFAVLAVLTVPAFNSIRGAGDVTRGGQIVADQIALASQEASTKNRDIEVRIAQLGGGDPGYRGVQIWVRGEAATNPIGRFETLPSRVLISSNSALSPLLSATATVNGTATFGGFGTLTYKGFRIRAGGTLDSEISASNNFLTVHSDKDTNTPPHNFFAVRINPVTGRITTYRP